MTAYVSNTTVAQAADLLSGARHVVITTHAKPDGDACGSAVAMAGALRAMGKDVITLFLPPMPANLDFIAALESSVHVCTASGSDAKAAAAVRAADVIAVLDTGAWVQLESLRPLLETSLGRVLILDHHLSGDMGAQHRCIDGHAAATCEIVAQVIEAWRRDDLFTAAVCEALFVGLAADTGWFRFSNTRAFSHELAAKLIRRGVDQAEVYRKLEENERPAKLALLARAIQSLRLLADDRAAVMVLRASDFQETGAMIEETEQFVDLPRAVGSVQVVALITQPPTNSKHIAPPKSGTTTPLRRSEEGEEAAMPPIRISFRSKPGPKAIDMSKLAQKFGGGGHARAAGAKVDAPLERVVGQVTIALSSLFAGH